MALKKLLPLVIATSLTYVGQSNPMLPIKRRRLLLSTLHPIGHTGYGQQAQLLVEQLQVLGWDVCLLTWDLVHRGESAADLEALLEKHGLPQEEVLRQAGGDERVLLSGVPVVTSKLAGGEGFKDGLGWVEILRASNITKPDLILHLHDAWWLGKPPYEVKQAAAAGLLPPRLAWLPILFDPLISNDPARPDRTGVALEFFTGVIAMSFWGRAVYAAALKGLAAKKPAGSKKRKKSEKRRLPPLLGRVPHALHPAFEEADLGPALTGDARRALGLPEDAFIVLVVGRNPQSQPHDANRKSHQAAVKAFARFKGWVQELCDSGNEPPESCRGGRSAVHLHLHCDIDGAVNLRQLLEDVGLSLGMGVSNTKEFLSAEGLRSLYNAADVLLQLSRAEGFGLPVMEAQACGTPVIANGATAMVENVFLGKVLPAFGNPRGAPGDRPGSWTPPDISVAAKALLEAWRGEANPVEQNKVRAIMSAEFSPTRVGFMMDQYLRATLPHDTVSCAPRDSVDVEDLCVEKPRSQGCQGHGDMETEHELPTNTSAATDMPQTIRHVLAAAKKSELYGISRVPKEGTVYAENLPPDTTDLDLYKLFAPFGAIAGVRAMLNSDGTCKGVGFVDFVDPASTARVVLSMGNFELPDGSRIKVTRKTSKQGSAA